MWRGNRPDEQLGEAREAPAGVLGQEWGEVVGLERGCWGLGRDTSAVSPHLACLLARQWFGTMHENFPHLCHVLVTSIFLMLEY